MNENEKPSTVTVDREVFSNLCAEANINRRPLARHLFSVAKYLGVGALIHAWLLGPEFDRDDLWSWAYLFAWPIPLTGWLLAKLGIFFLYAGTLSIICALIWWGVIEFVERRGAARRLDARRDARFRQPPPRWTDY